MKNFKWILYLVGISILTLGIVLMIKSNLGTSPLDALLVALTYKVGLSIGAWEVLISLVIVGINAIITMRKPQILGLMTALITGTFIDVWMLILKELNISQTFGIQFIYFSIGLIITSFGTAIYLRTNFAPIPLDNLMLIITDKMKKSIQFSKSLIYILVLLLAFLMNGPIGLGTILTACLGGITLNYCILLINKLVN
ncbi:hypothetical protein J0J70_08440 [Turicibacter bilis]|uniref:YitT family protein n=1 Tax=Turicibacter bilis TaxID=2735723 RepID=A0A9Q9CEU9_9FIRM|nr:hypothetical protein [Turicibacter bilis]MBS3199165.1 YitT family protein [Turicibacter bilis]UUF07654.1 hypothetical protein J0J70_08440 [Turicibacter bilis]